MISEKVNLIISLIFLIVSKTLKIICSALMCIVFTLLVSLLAMIGGVVIGLILLIAVPIYTYREFNKDLNNRGTKLE